MKKLFIYLTVSIFGLATMSSCVGDLTIDKPIDPSLTNPSEVLNSPSAFYQLLAKCYMGLATSGSQGPDSSPDIDGVDGGFGQYMRALYYMQTLTTDEAVIGWNDGTLRDLHGLSWTNSDLFIAAMYYRIGQQISTCNELIRKANEYGFADNSDVKLYIAEARALRALSYYHAIDMFGGFPFTTEASSVGATNPPYKTRAELYEWLVNEVQEITPLLKDEKTNVYGRCDKGLTKMILAKLYLGSQVYTGTAQWKACADVCSDIIAKYPTLHSNYSEMFVADNNRCTDEIIFAVEQDGINTQSYGATNFLIFGSTGSEAVKAENTADQDKENDLFAEYRAMMGISSGWGGMRTTPQFVDLFEAGDQRAFFYDHGHTKEIADLGTFVNGYAVTKFRNVNHDGTAAQATGFVDTDEPVFRSADAYLMLAECAKRDSSVDQTAALNAYNAVHTRAGLSAVSSYTLDDVLDERGRELYWECFRRSDLIRFGRFTTDAYIWSWKGGTQEGQSVNSKFNLMPIPANDMNCNPNLVQNEGY